MNSLLKIFLVIPGLIAVASAAPQARPTRGFTVNITSRNDVLEFWHTTYAASEGYESRVGWTGNYNGGNGAVSSAFVGDVERRVNFFRSLCGVPSVVRVNTGSRVATAPENLVFPPAATTKSSAAQAAALLIARNFDPSTGTAIVSHDPPSNLVGWTPAAWNGSAFGNLALGVYGPGAVDHYMIEELTNGSVASPWNYQVGHRRWILYPPATDFATGDQPGNGVQVPPTNTLYVIQSAAEKNPAVAPRFVAYPPAGFFPAYLNSRFWSLSHPGADFSTASVKVTTSSGGNIPIIAIHRDSSYADPAMIWELSGAPASRSVGNDATYRVTITGVKGLGIPATHSYSVTLINPEKLTADQTLRGPATVKANSTATYQFTPPDSAEQLRVTVSKNLPATWAETAEDGVKSSLPSSLSSAYSFRTANTALVPAIPLTGKKSFRLTFPTLHDPSASGAPEQIAHFSRPLLPKSKATLEFSYFTGYMTAASHLAVEASRDDGATWARIGGIINGDSSNRPATTARKMKIKLPKSNVPLRIRFRYYCDPYKPVFIIQDHLATGIFLDDIRVNNCANLETTKVNTLPANASKFVFSKASAKAPLKRKSAWAISLSTRIGGHWFPAGPTKFIKVK